MDAQTKKRKEKEKGRKENNLIRTFKKKKKILIRVVFGQSDP